MCFFNSERITSLSFSIIFRHSLRVFPVIIVMLEFLLVYKMEFK
ncbi:Uncharacterised protein [Salmonella enterica subsp. enterica serovar Typhi]|nr:Uncharacterised protein [Salmonella enterica subsp. enterica serovar Typhi]CQU12394.1 Uncharacterised protein [Salmonella enterica subsp. enterica serovar Typhi]CQU49135.1 Uncharacterised protein [Salmonella enterica subsp. enterica serovar Typhi]CQW46114.1 Uncharacterised protein [Salmonella enterica subsp. enterica serovar Typhi]CQY04595.1 Uncharacterised protein [Salmonella enterica subsp. enterica serovar Typhi]